MVTQDQTSLSVNIPRSQRCPGEQNTTPVDGNHRAQPLRARWWAKPPWLQRGCLRTLRVLTHQLSLLLRVVPKSHSRRFPVGKPCKPLPPQALSHAKKPRSVQPSIRAALDPCKALAPQQRRGSAASPPCSPRHCFARPQRRRERS